MSPQCPSVAALRAGTSGFDTPLRPRRPFRTGWPIQCQPEQIAFKLHAPFLFSLLYLLPEAKKRANRFGASSASQYAISVYVVDGDDKVSISCNYWSSVMSPALSTCSCGCLVKQGSRQTSSGNKTGRQNLFTETLQMNWMVTAEHISEVIAKASASIERTRHPL